MDIASNEWIEGLHYTEVFRDGLCTGWKLTEAGLLLNIANLEEEIGMSAEELLKREAEWTDPDTFESGLLSTLYRYYVLKEGFPPPKEDDGDEEHWERVR